MVDEDQKSSVIHTHVPFEVATHGDEHPTGPQVWDLHNVHEVGSIAEVGLYKYENQVTLQVYRSPTAHSTRHKCACSYHEALFLQDTHTQHVLCHMHAIHSVFLHLRETVCPHIQVSFSTAHLYRLYMTTPKKVFCRFVHWLEVCCRETITHSTSNKVCNNMACIELWHISWRKRLCNDCPATFTVKQQRTVRTTSTGVYKYISTIWIADIFVPSVLDICIDPKQKQLTAMDNALVRFKELTWQLDHTFSSWLTLSCMLAIALTPPLSSSLASYHSVKRLVNLLLGGSSAHSLSNTL